MTKTPTDPSAGSTSPAPLFRLDLPHGRCVGVPITDEVVADTTPELPDPNLGFSATNPSPPDLNPGLPVLEWEFLCSLPPARRVSFAAGRRALRHAFADLGMPIGDPLLPLPPPRGGPRLPAGVLGSISHKRALAVGLAAPAPLGSAPAAIGVDLEEIRVLRVDLGRRVLTPREREQQSALPKAHQDEFVLERFSLKEAFYKAVNGFVGPDVSFQDLEITDISPDGKVTWSAPILEQFGLQGEGRVFRPVNGFLLTTVLVRTSRSP
jgi:4'-phosphopantetheinyl transferase EntD